MSEFRKVQEISKSLFIGLPAKIADKLSVGKGDYLSIDIENNKMIIKPVHPSAKTNVLDAAHEPLKVGECNE